MELTSLIFKWRHLTKVEKDEKYICQSKTTLKAPFFHFANHKVLSSENGKKDGAYYMFMKDSIVSQMCPYSYKLHNKLSMQVVSVWLIYMLQGWNDHGLR